jgi:ABC-type branched-subunit amino acid transport system ATPase component
MKVADRVYCMMEGRVTLEGLPGDLSRVPQSLDQSLHRGEEGRRRRLA